MTIDLFDGIARHATFSRDEQSRFTLTRAWREGSRVCFIGLNPSTADHRVDDPTVRRWTAYAKAWGYAGFVAVNLYPYRASDPRDCRRWAAYEANGPDWSARDDILHNIGVVAHEAKAAGLVVACWGCASWGLDHDILVDTVIAGITTGPEPWPDVHALRLSPGGMPMHPMARGRNRLPDDLTPVLWRPGTRLGAAA